MSKHFAKSFSCPIMRCQQLKKPIRRDRPLLMEMLEDRILLSTSYLSGPDTLAHPLIPVVLSTAATKTVTVSYAITAGTTASGKDYTLPPGKLTFQPGDTIQDIPL